MKLQHLLKRPVITEKSLKDASQGVFTFIVDPHATKYQLKKAISDQFQVTVIDVKVANLKGKAYRVGRTRIIRQKPLTKKAYIRLASGQKIDLFDIEEK